MNIVESMISIIFELIKFGLSCKKDILSFLGSNHVIHNLSGFFVFGNQKSLMCKHSLRELSHVMSA